MIKLVDAWQPLPFLGKHLSIFLIKVYISRKGPKLVKHKGTRLLAIPQILYSLSDDVYFSSVSTHRPAGKNTSASCFYPVALVQTV